MFLSELPPSFDFEHVGFTEKGFVLVVRNVQRFKTVDFVSHTSPLEATNWKCDEPPPPPHRVLDDVS